MNEQIQEVLALTNRWVKRLSREKFSMLFTLDSADDLLADFLW